MSADKASINLIIGNWNDSIFCIVNENVISGKFSQAPEEERISLI